MKKLNLFLAVAVAAATVVIFFAAGAAAVEEYTIDPVHSSAEFKVKHLGIANVRGNFTDISGTLMLDRKNPSKSAVEIKIGTASVDTRNKMRDEDLRSENFFDAKKYPTMTFKSRKVKKTGKESAEVTGDFTLHGVTKPITVKVNFTGEGKGMQGEYRIGFETEFKIKRSEYGMKPHRAVGDLVQIWFEAELVGNGPGK